MAIGDVYQLTLFWDFVAQECQNVFHYELISGSDPDHTNSLFQAFHEDLIPLIRACTSDQCILDHAELINLMDYSEFYNSGTLGYAGDIVSGATQTGASFLSYGFRLEKAYPGAPNGHKRFPGVAEGYTAENVYDPPGSAATFLKNGLQTVISESSLTDIFNLVIVHRPFSELVPPVLWWLVTKVIYTNLTSQNSRKA